MKTQISATEACDLILFGPTFLGPFFEQCNLGILNQWLIAIFDENSNFSHWSLWSDSVWTYILGAIFWKTVRKRVTMWFSELHLFSCFPYGNRMFIPKYWSWLIFHLLNISENLNLQFGSRWNFSHQLHHEKKIPKWMAKLLCFQYTLPCHPNSEFKHSKL